MNQSSDDRKVLMNEVFAAALNAAHGAAQLTEQQLSQLMVNLVRSKILSADDSYKLQERLRDGNQLDRSLDARIKARLQYRGIYTADALKEIQERLSRLESQRAA